MRGNRVEGRFKIDYETMSMDEGMVDELRLPVGTEVDWWEWDEADYEANAEDYLDPIYSVSNQTDGLGRKWKEPFEMPVILAQQIRGQNIFNERGLYTVDTLRLVIAVDDVNRLLPNIIANPTEYIRDRIVFQNHVFTPQRVNPRGRYKERYSVVTLDCVQVNAEEMVNDSQFQQYAI